MQRVRYIRRTYGTPQTGPVPEHLDVAAHPELQETSGWYERGGILPRTPAGRTTEICVCGDPIHPCTGSCPVLTGDPPRQMPMMWCNGWVHTGGWHRCGWPDGHYGISARPRT